MHIAKIDNFVSPQQRVDDNLVAVLVSVSSSDWVALRRLPMAFYEEFEITLSLSPVDEIYVMCSDKVSWQTLENMSAFIAGYIS